MNRWAVGLVSVGAALAVVFSPAAATAIEYGPDGYLNPRGEPMMRPEMQIVKVVPGKWNKRRPYYPRPGKVYFRITAERGMYSSVACEGLSWQNFYDKTNVRSGRTYRMTVSAGDPSDWSKPAVYDCVVGTLATGVPEPEDWDWRLGPWTGETWLTGEKVQFEVPATPAKKSRR